jgi:predicted PurR-regulated permease PerM
MRPRPLVTAACVVIGVAALKAADGVLIPVAVALFLSVLSVPLMTLLLRWRMPRILALLLTLLTVYSAIGLMLYGGGTLLRNFWREVPAYVLKLQLYLDRVGGWLEGQGVAGAQAAIGRLFDVEGIIDFVTHQDVIAAVAPLAGATFGTVATLMVSLVVVLVLMLVALRAAPGWTPRAAQVSAAGGPDWRALARSVQHVQEYLGVKTLISLATGLLAAGLCMLFGLKHPLLWGLLAFILNFIPAVGSTAAGIPAAVEALVLHGVGPAIGVAIGYAAINFILDSLIQPMLIGNRFGISGLVIVLSVVFWGWLWGGIGLFLAVPLTMLVKVLLENSGQFRWVALAMTSSDDEPGRLGSRH